MRPVLHVCLNSCRTPMGLFFFAAHRTAIKKHTAMTVEVSKVRNNPRLGPGQSSLPGCGSKGVARMRLIKKRLIDQG